MLNDDFDLPEFNLMANLKNREMFKNRNNITHLLKIRGTSLKAKHKIIITANTPLFYIFGYTLESKPWLSYKEIYANTN
jgi:hypothetical protein